MSYFVVMKKSTGEYLGNYSKAFRCSPMRKELKMARKYKSVSSAIGAVKKMFDQKEFSDLVLKEIE